MSGFAIPAKNDQKVQKVQKVQKDQYDKNSEYHLEGQT
jgi:hypothetical protein